MANEWPREIHRRADGSGVVYELPIRPLGGFRWVGIFLAGVGLFFAGGPLRLVIGQLSALVTGTAASVGDWISVVFHLPFILAGLIPIALGCFMMYGRCRVECRNRRLRVTELATPFRWSRRLPAEPVRRLHVEAAGEEERTSPSQHAIYDLSVLLVQTDRAKPRLLVLGYPRSWLLAMAQELSALLNPLAGVAGAPSVAVQEGTLAKSALVAEPAWETEQPPAGCQVRVESRATGIALLVPPAGLVKGSKGLFFFALLWCGFMVLFSAAAIGGSLKGDADVGLLGILAFLALFWAVGLGLMAGAVNMGRRRALLIVENDQLRIAQIGPFGNRTWTWNAHEVARVCAGPSGMKVNKRPVIELQIHPKNGKKIGLLAGRDPQELAWIATRLRQALHPEAPPVMSSAPPPPAS